MFGKTYRIRVGMMMAMAFVVGYDRCVSAEDRGYDRQFMYQNHWGGQTPEAVMQQRLRQWDKNGDGEISQDELRAAEVQDATRRVQAMDRDMDGTVTDAEMQRGHKALQRQIREQWGHAYPAARQWQEQQRQQGKSLPLHPDQPALGHTP